MSNSHIQISAHWDCTLSYEDIREQALFCIYPKKGAGRRYDCIMVVHSKREMPDHNRLDFIGLSPHHDGIEYSCDGSTDESLIQTDLRKGLIDITKNLDFAALKCTELWADNAFDKYCRHKNKSPRFVPVKKGVLIK